MATPVSESLGHEILPLTSALLDWYDREGRTFPWRVRPEDREAGRVPDPYAVWLSEIMLQQTTIPHGTPYWHRFLARWPTVMDLAAAERDDVMAMWAGLGYYARARNLHKCAQVVSEEHGGLFPGSEAELLKLPGIGPYTAAAIATICFGQRATVVDGNVERVISRLYRVETPLPKAKREIKALARPLVSAARPGDYSQALMDLGATICTPKTPGCASCPWAQSCAAHRDGVETDYPKKLKKTKLPTRYGVVFVGVLNEQLLMRLRPDSGMLGGMLEFPGSRWDKKAASAGPDEPLGYAPVKGEWLETGEVRHVFSHFELFLRIYRADIVLTADSADDAWRMIKADSMEAQPIPNVMMKVWKRASQR